MGKDWEVSYSDEPNTKSSEFSERCRCVETGHVLETRQTLCLHNGIVFNPLIQVLVLPPS